MLVLHMPITCSMIWGMGSAFKLINNISKVEQQWQKSFSRFNLNPMQKPICVEKILTFELLHFTIVMIKFAQHDVESDFFIYIFM